MSEHDSDRRAVIVGIDGSPGSAIALRWAVDHAARLGRVVPVATFTSGPFEHGFGAVLDASQGGEPYRSEATLRLASFLQQHAAALVDDGIVVEHHPGPGLVEASDGAELLVVGTRGWGRREDSSIGSVGAYCARHARVPVALIPRHVPPIHDRLSVVVGVDGSAGSVEALRWAIDHVRHTAVVTAVRATTEAHVVGDPLSPSTAEFEEDARAELERIVARVVATADGHPEVELLVVHGDPRQELASVLPDTDLLVVGARGHGLIRRLLLGSVASALVHHPTLPTVVVPAAGR